MSNFKAKSPEELPPELLALLQQTRAAGKKVVLVTGVFDILHSEHKNFLQKAQAVGDILVIGLESDKRVQKIKGDGRPVNSEDKRRQHLEKLGLADLVFILPDEFSKAGDHRALIQQIQPDVLAVSSHTKHLDKKREILEEFGGEVRVVHQHNPEVSTTLLLEERG